MNLRWRDVFDSFKIWPKDYGQCRLVAESVNYRHLAFNGLVYSVSDEGMKNPICKIEELE